MFCLVSGYQNDEKVSNLFDDFDEIKVCFTQSMYHYSLTILNSDAVFISISNVSGS